MMVVSSASPQHAIKNVDRPHWHISAESLAEVPGPPAMTCMQRAVDVRHYCAGRAASMEKKSYTR